MDFQSLRDNSLAYAIIRLQKDFKHFCESRLVPYGLTNGRYFYLIYLNNHPGCSLNALSQGLQVGKAHTTRTVAQLEALGYAVRKPDPTDSRAFCLSLTESGTAVLCQIRNLFAAWDGAAKRTIEVTQYRAVVDALLDVQRTIDWSDL